MLLSEIVLGISIYQRQPVLSFLSSEGNAFKQMFALQWRRNRVGLWVGLRDVESLPIIFPPIFSHLDKFNKPALSASSLPGVVAVGVTEREG